MIGREVLFVCTGNICRSPMAEYLFRAHAGAAHPWCASSAGVMAGDGMAASTMAVDVLRERGIDMRAHRSRMVTREMVAAAEVIVTMTLSHRAQLWAMFRETVSQKTFILKEFNGRHTDWDVVDPIGSSIDVYRAVCNEIDAALPGLLTFLNSLDIPESGGAE